MKTKEYKISDVLKMLNYVEENPTEYRVVVYLKRTHETIVNLTKKAYYTPDYYMFDLSDGDGDVVYDKFNVVGVMFDKDYACDASKLNAVAFIMKLIRHNKVDKIVVESY